MTLKPKKTTAIFTWSERVTLFTMMFLSIAMVTSFDNKLLQEARAFVGLVLLISIAALFYAGYRILKNIHTGSYGTGTLSSKKIMTLAYGFTGLTVILFYGVFYSNYPQELKNIISATWGLSLVAFIIIFAFIITFGLIKEPAQKDQIERTSLPNLTAATNDYVSDVSKGINPESLQSIIDYINDGEADLNVVKCDLSELITLHNSMTNSEKETL
jgi:hypothetical protein